MKTIARAFVLVAIGVTLGAIHSWIVPLTLREAGPPRSGNGDAAPNGSTPDPANGTEDPGVNGATTEPAADVEGLTLEEAYAKWEAGVPFLDARSQEEYEAGHIEYAVHLNRRMANANSPVLDLLFPDLEYVIYCEGGDCDNSKDLREILEAAGFTNLLIMTDGYDKWAEAGYPTAEGPDEALDAIRPHEADTPPGEESDGTGGGG